jgi:protoporphyrinogen/coproporphyrinogen III oxidase
MIAIVGGGLTGLALGYQLRARGAPHTVLEASDRPGGVIRSRRLDGHLLEWGPQRARLTTGLRRLVADLDLEDELLIAPAGLPLFVFTRGKLRRVPYSAAQFARTDLLGWRGKARLLLEPFTAGPRPGEGVADYFIRKMGREAYENLLGPLYGGLYASDPADMVVELSLGHVLREFRIDRSLLLPLLRRGGAISPPPACSFREGLQTLPMALREHDRENVRLSTPVRALRRRGSGFAVALDEGEVRADTVVLTTPAPTTAALLRHVAPAAAHVIAQLTYNPLAVVHLYAETQLSGLGYQVSFTERLATRGVTFNDSLFARRGVFTAYLGGAKAPEIVELADEEIGTLAVEEFEQVTGYRARVLAVERERMPAWDTSWKGLRGLQLPRGIRLAANWESRPGMPGRLGQAERLANELAPRAD